MDKPLSVETIHIHGKDYQAFYFGKIDISSLKDYQHRKFWQLENAYDDFKGYAVTGNVLPYDNYPMKIEMGNIYIIEYTKKDGTIRREYHRADGHTWNNQLVTEEMQIQGNNPNNE